MRASRPHARRPRDAAARDLSGIGRYCRQPVFRPEEVADRVGAARASLPAPARSSGRAATSASFQLRHAPPDPRGSARAAGGCLCGFARRACGRLIVARMSAATCGDSTVDPGCRHRDAPGARLVGSSGLRARPRRIARVRDDSVSFFKCPAGAPTSGRRFPKPWRRRSCAARRTMGRSAAARRAGLRR